MTQPVPDHTKKLSVIIPAYNKDSEVFHVVLNLVHQLKKLQYDWEIIIVDDASRDWTLREAIRSKKFNGNTARIKVFSYNLNQGKGFALYYGFKKSMGDIVIFADSDLDLPADNIGTLLEYQRRGDADIAIGSKRHPDSTLNYPIVRRFQSKCYQLLVKLLFNLNVSDTQVGLKAFRRKVLSESFSRIVVKKFAFDVELLVIARSLGYKKIIEVPVTLNYNFTSTISLKCVRDILQDTLAIYYRKNFLRFYDSPHYTLDGNEVVISNRQAFI